MVDIDSAVSDDLDPVDQLAYEEEFQAIYDVGKPEEQAEMDTWSEARKREIVDLCRRQKDELRKDNRPKDATRRRKI